MGRMEVPHPTKGHVVMTWGEAPDTTAPEYTEAEVREAFRALITEGWGAAVIGDDGKEHYTRRFDSSAKIIKMIPRFAGG